MSQHLLTNPVRCDFICIDFHQAFPKHVSVEDNLGRISTALFLVDIDLELGSDAPTNVPEVEVVDSPHSTTVIKTEDEILDGDGSTSMNPTRSIEMVSPDICLRRQISQC